MNTFGTPDAERVYARYADLLYRLAFTHLASAEDAEDAVSDVFVKFLQNPPAFRDDEHEKAWFIRVLINQCNDLHRRRNIRAWTPLESVTHLGSAEEKESDVLSAVRRLPEKNRIAVLLHYFEGYSLEETAHLLQTTEAAVKMRLMRSRSLLKSHLKGAEG